MCVEYRIENASYWNLVQNSKTIKINNTRFNNRHKPTYIYKYKCIYIYI